MNEPPLDLIEEIADVETVDGTMAVIRKRPKLGDCPGVVMFHDGPGIRNATHVFARELAGAGFDVVVPDLYHRHGRMIGYELHEREADPALVDELWSLLDSLDDGQTQDDLDAALAATGLNQRERLGTIGFCVGARAVYRTMMRLPGLFVAGAMWHPSFLCDSEPDSPHRSAAEFPGDLFIGIGADDRQVPVATQQPFLDAVAGLDHVDVQIYGGADHGYTWRGWPNYSQSAASKSFDVTVTLLERHLREPTVRRSTGP